MSKELPFIRIEVRDGVAEVVTKTEGVELELADYDSHPDVLSTFDVYDVVVEGRSP